MGRNKNKRQFDFLFMGKFREQEQSGESEQVKPVKPGLHWKLEADYHSKQ